MRILITGGLGYLGNRISKFLSDKGHDIRILALRTSDSGKKIPDDCEIQEGSVLSKSDAEKACKEMDCVIHLAGLDQDRCAEDPELALKINGLGTRTVLEAGAAEGVKLFIYFSSFHIYGPAEGIITEKTLPAPINDYGISKLLGEMYCRKFNRQINTVVLRLSNSYGASASKSGSTLVVNSFCSQCYESGKIVLKSKGEQKRNFVAITDVNQAIDILLKSEPDTLNNKVFNVGSSHTPSILEVAKIVAQAYKEKFGSEIKIDIPKNAQDQKVLEFVYNYDEISKLGYKPNASMKDEVNRIFDLLESEKHEKR